MSSKVARDPAVAEDIIREAGEVIRAGLHDEYTTSWKANNTPVTTIDTTVNDLVIARLRAVYPEDRVLGEERSAPGTSDYTWVVDPVDGTQALGILPTVTCCIACVGPDGQPIFSYIYNPERDELFAGRAGELSLLNGESLHVSDKSDSNGAYVFLGSRTLPGFAPTGTIFTRLEAQAAKIFNVRSLAFGCCMVAAGKAAGAFTGVKTPFEAAAVKLIIEGAGGLVTDLAGNSADSFRYDGDMQGLIVSNGKIHEVLVAAARDLEA